jgi:hypothetical protein
MTDMKKRIEAISRTTPFDEGLFCEVEKELVARGFNLKEEMQKEEANRPVTRAAIEASCEEIQADEHHKYWDWLADRWGVNLH